MEFRDDDDYGSDDSVDNGSDVIDRNNSSFDWLFSETPLSGQTEDEDVLIDRILQRCRESSFPKPQVILLLGSQGTGKSCMVNTIHKVLTGEYITLAAAGGGGIQTNTKFIKWYRNCGVLPENIRDPDRRDRMRDIIPKLPHIVDIAGFRNEDYYTLLDLVIGGCIPPDTQITNLQTEDPDRLRAMYQKSTPEWKVSDIVLIQSVNSPVQDVFTKTLNRVLTSSDSSLLQKYNVPVYLFVSKWDLVQYNGRQRNRFANLTGRREAKTGYKTVEDKITTMVSHLNVEGNSKSLVRPWASYMDDTCNVNRFIDNNVLQCLELLIKNRRLPQETPPIKQGTNYTLLRYDLKVKIQAFMKKLFFLCVFLLFPVIIAQLVYWFLQA